MVPTFGGGPDVITFLTRRRRSSCPSSSLAKYNFPTHPQSASPFFVRVSSPERLCDRRVTNSVRSEQHHSTLRTVCLCVCVVSVRCVLYMENGGTREFLRQSVTVSSSPWRRNSRAHKKGEHTWRGFMNCIINGRALCRVVAGSIGVYTHGIGV